MRRIAVISCVFAVLFVVICLSSCDCSCDFCTCNDNARMTVDVHECSSCSELCSNGCSTEAGKETLDGYHMECGCYDWYCFPSACGIYENAYTTPYPLAKTNSCMPSCVLFGFDLCMWECYGDTQSALGSDYETRDVIDAVEGAHYTIEKKILIIDGVRYDCTDGEIDISALDPDGDKKIYGNSVQIEIHFTALKDLCVVHGWAYVGDDWSWSDWKGNNGGVNSYSKNCLKSLNVKQGEHVFVFGSEQSNLYTTIENINTAYIEFKAFAYGGK